MREVRGNLWVYPSDIRVIPTNGSLNLSGEAIMGRGVAREAADRHLFLPLELGKRLRKQGNHVYVFDTYKLVTFPTKNRWEDESPLDLIEQSVEEFKSVINPNLRYSMPRVGCGLGGRDWLTEVRPLLLTLPNNVSVISYG